MRWSDFLLRFGQNLEEAMGPVDPDQLGREHKEVMDQIMFKANAFLDAHPDAKAQLDRYYADSFDWGHDGG